MRVALGLTYDGSPFSGWQSQPSGNGVQDHLEAALAAVAGHALRVTAAGRTDAGVHAAAQVVHFDTGADRPDSAWVRGTNAHLAPQIAVQWSTRVDQAFDARRSAQARSYRYVLLNHPVRAALFSGRVGWYHRWLDLEAMRAGASALEGEHDFSAFRSSECQAATPVRIVESLRIERREPYVIFDITANAFLHHMVRNIVGSLVRVGKGAERPEWIAGLLDSRDRRLAAPTMSASGLYLAAVRYGADWALPDFPAALPLLCTAGEA